MRGWSLCFGVQSLELEGRDSGLRVWDAMPHPSKVLLQRGSGATKSKTLNPKAARKVELENLHDARELCYYIFLLGGSWERSKYFNNPYKP